MIAFADIAQAGLINYERRKSRSGEGAPSTQRAAPAQPSGPSWTRESPRVRTSEERRYDINRDGLLQTAEVKIFLRDIIDIITQRGGYTVNSDILREYDKNRDGVISSTELPQLSSDVSRY